MDEIRRKRGRERKRVIEIIDRVKIKKELKRGGRGRGSGRIIKMIETS